MERKEFLRLSCMLCVAIGGAMTFAELESCASVPAIEADAKDKTISLPLSLFQDREIQIVRPKNLGFEIAVRKLPDATFTALVLRCTHASNELEYTGSLFYCSVHGSTFALDGTATRGPASKPLQALATRIDGTNLTILL